MGMDSSLDRLKKLAEKEKQDIAKDSESPSNNPDELIVKNNIEPSTKTISKSNLSTDTSYPWMNETKIEEPAEKDFSLDFAAKPKWKEEDPVKDINDYFKEKNKEVTPGNENNLNSEYRPNLEYTQDTKSISKPIKNKGKFGFKKLNNTEINKTDNKEKKDLVSDSVPKEAIHLDFENKKIAEKPLSEDFAPREDLTWLKKEIIEEPTEKDFENNYAEHPKWVHEKEKAKQVIEEKKVETKISSLGGNIFKAKGEIKPVEVQPEKIKQESIPEKKTENTKAKKISESKTEKKISEPITNSSKADNEKKKESETNWLGASSTKEFSFDNPSTTKDDIVNGEVTKNPQELVTDDFVIEPKWKKDTVIEPKKVAGIRTPIDEMFGLLTSYKQIDTAEIAKYTGLDFYDIEKIAKIFEEYGVVELKYPTSLNRKPIIKLVKEIESKIKEVPKGEIMESYDLTVDNVPGKVSIILVSDEVRPVYSLDIPKVGKYTREFLRYLKNEIAETLPIEIEDITDPKKSLELKDRFFAEAKVHLKKYFPNSSDELLDPLSGVVLHDMYGLGSIEIIMGDNMLEEVAINSSKTPITVYHKVHGWMKTNIYPGSEDEIFNYASQIGRKVGREITVLSPILDAHLLSGDRVNATLSPITSEGNTLTIRRFSRRPWTITDLIGKAHTMNSEMAALLWLAMQYELNILIAGGTASGKTSTLNTLLSLIPSYHRIISIEDVREITLPIFLKWNWIPMVTRSANPEGMGEVTMLDCMVTSLRMRPDRIIVGEIRRKKEAEVLMEAIETGHSIYSTLHANSAYQVLRRLSEPPMSVPPMQIEQIDIIVTQYRDRKTNKRRTYEIAEIEQTSTGKGLQVNTIYKWSPRTDEWENLNKPSKLLTLLNLHTGMTEEDIDKELAERVTILDWLKQQNISELDMVGFVAKLYYTDKEKIKEFVVKKTTREEIEKMMK